MCSCSQNSKELKATLIAVRLGNDDACAKLLRMYAPLIGSLVRSTMSKLPPSAETDEDELRQEAAIKLYQAALSYDLDEDISFGLYAKICLKNRMISLLRRYSADAEPSTVELTEAAALGEGSDDPSEMLLQTERERELELRIKSSLSPLEYDVFNLYTDGMKPTEISKMLGIATKTAENAVYRMKAKLAKIFQSL